MDTKDWFLVLGPLLGVLVGGGISSIAKYLELRTVRRFELDKLRINKIEELCLELGNLKNCVSKCGEIAQTAVYEGKRGKEVQDAYVPYYEKISKSIETIRVLQANYAKAAKPHFEAVKTAWNSMIDALYSTAFHDSSGERLQKAIFQIKLEAQELQETLGFTTQSLLLEKERPI
jgi:hypothetical protein